MVDNLFHAGSLFSSDSSDVALGMFYSPLLLESSLLKVYHNYHIDIHCIHNIV